MDKKQQETNPASFSAAPPVADAHLLREKIYDTLNRAAMILLSRGGREFADAMTEGIGLISDIVGLDRMSVFRNSPAADGLTFSQLYRWRKEGGGTTAVLPSLNNTAYARLVPSWEAVLERGECVNGVASQMREAEALKRYGCVSVFAVPVFNDGGFWGFTLFEKFKEEIFCEYEASLLRASSLMLTNAVIRNDEAAIIRQAGKQMRLMLDASPLSITLWDESRRVIDCNEAAVVLLQARDKKALAERFFECAPEYQPDGSRSGERALLWVSKAFAEGRCVFEWTHKALDGTLIPSEVTLVRVKHGNSYVVAGYSRDLRERNRMMREIEHKNFLLQTVNRVSAIILKSRADTLEENLLHSMEILSGAVEADRAYIWQNHRRNGALYCSQIYEWSESAPSQQNNAFAAESLYDDVSPMLRELLSQGRCINSIVSEMPESAQAVLSPQGILSILIVPIFLENLFWGFVGFDDCHSERVFSENEEIILRSASEMIAGALSRTHLEMEADKIYYDPLTGIYNRRFFDENLKRIVQTLSRSGGTLTLMMIDIDYFKEYNDLYGHVEGDSCLKSVAETLRGGITRADDFAARYGGEEFAAVLPNTGETGARLIAKRLLENIRARGIPHEKNDALDCVTVSIGVATGKVERAHSADDFVRRADEMLYISKRDGRNRYTLGSCKRHTVTLDGWIS